MFCSCELRHIRPDGSITQQAKQGDELPPAFSSSRTSRPVSVVFHLVSVHRIPCSSHANKRRRSPLRDRHPRIRSVGCKSVQRDPPGRRVDHVEHLTVDASRRNRKRSAGCLDDHRIIADRPPSPHRLYLCDQSAVGKFQTDPAGVCVPDPHRRFPDTGVCHVQSRTGHTSPPSPIASCSGRARVSV